MKTNIFFKRLDIHLSSRKGVGILCQSFRVKIKTILIT